MNHNKFAMLGMLLVFLAIPIAFGQQVCTIRGVEDAVTTDLNTPITIDVLSNDIKTPTTIISGVQSPTAKGGKAVKTVDNKILYTPKTGYCGGDSFSYAIKDTAVLNCYGKSTVYITIPCCKPCTAMAPAIEVCEGLSEDEIEAAAIAAGAGCGADCVDTTPMITVADDGKSYTATCTGECGSTTATGAISYIVDSCVPNAPPIEVCEGADDLAIMAAIKTALAGCDCADTTDSISIALDRKSYTVTCNGDCGPVTAIGTINYHIETCKAYAPPIEVCEGADDLAIMAAIKTALAGCDCADTTDSISIALDRKSYTVTCNGDCGPISETGSITIPNCEAKAPDFDICEGTPLADSVFIENGADCTCDTEPVIAWVLNPGTGKYDYTVTCNERCGPITNSGEVGIKAIDCDPMDDFISEQPLLAGNNDKNVGTVEVEISDGTLIVTFVPNTGVEITETHVQPSTDASTITCVPGDYEYKGSALSYMIDLDDIGLDCSDQNPVWLYIAAHASVTYVDENGEPLTDADGRPLTDTAFAGTCEITNCGSGRWNHLICIQVPCECVCLDE